MTEQLPAPGTTAARVIINLDELEREAKKEPFSFVLDERQIVLADPADLDWQDVDQLDDEREFLTLAMSEEDHAFFISHKMPIWKITHLGQAYQKHYGTDEPGKAD